MTVPREEKRRYVLEAGTGHYALTGSSSAFSNTVLIASEALRSPLEKSVIEPPPAAPPSPITISPTFKLVFISVLAITVFSGVAQIVMASIWATPTASQKEVFDAMGFAWKVGFGAIVGLLGGKVT
jgi:hypothetical protein